MVQLEKRNVIFFSSSPTVCYLVSSCLARVITPPLCVSACVHDPSLAWWSRYLPQGDHVFGRQSVQPTAGTRVLQEQPKPLLPLQPGGYALCTCVCKGRLRS